jgi:hypothetical protein
MVQIGVSSKKILQQDDCIVIRRGRFYSLSEEISCAILSGLDESWDGAVRCNELVKWLDKSREEEIQIEFDSKILKVKGSERKWVKFATEADVILPVESVELPKKADWQKLSEEFCQAVAAVARSTDEHGSFTNECLHICPERMEACDNTEMTCWTLTCPVHDSVLVRGKTAKKIAQLGMSRAAETDNWLHFANSVGLRVSLRKFAVEKYPDLSEFLGLRGDKLAFPGSVIETLERSAIFASDKGIRVNLADNAATFEGQKEVGHSFETLDVEYEGRPRHFGIAPKRLIDLIEHSAGQIEVTDCSLRSEVDSCVRCLTIERI